MLHPHAVRSLRGEFAERFKYTVISSSLLSTELSLHSSSPSSARRLSLTRRLSDDLHQRMHDTHDNDPRYDNQQVQSQESQAKAAATSLTFPFLLVVLITFLTGYYVTAFLMLVSAKWYSHRFGTQEMALQSQQNQHVPSALLQSLDTLQSLIDAESAWSSAVREAVTMLEREE